MSAVQGTKKIAHVFNHDVWKDDEILPMISPSIKIPSRKQILFLHTFLDFCSKYPQISADGDPLVTLRAGSISI